MHRANARIVESQEQSVQGRGIVGLKEKHARLKPLPPDIERRLDMVMSVLLRHPVRLAYVFGSAARNPAAASDVDLAVLPDDGFSYTRLYADLSSLLGTDRLDLADLRSATPLLQWEVVTTGRRVLAISDLEAAVFEQTVRNRYRDHRVRSRRRTAVPGGARAMSIRRDLIQHSLDDLERVAQELDRYRHVTADALARDLSLRWTVERGLLAGLSLVFQVAEHILAAHFRRFPDTYEGLLAELRDCGVLPEPLYARLRGSGGFRNVLVHEYIKVDLKEVQAALVGAPSAFRAFGQAVSAWLASLPEDA